jgi:glycosyltransferase involved in cell wall biosynthesis
MHSLPLGLTSTRRAEARPAFIVWLGYQRRSEVLAPLFGAEARFFPHVFRPKLLRPLDYLIKLILTLAYLLRFRPSYVIIQAPPLFPALPAILTRTPYVLDVHNALIQSFWSKIPFNGTFIRHAAALIAHNCEIGSTIRQHFPNSKVFTIADPVPVIGDDAQPRDTRHILLICSFHRDEPISLILDTVRALPDFTFTITADIQRLPRDLQVAFAACVNVRLTGFLSTDAYHSVLCSSKAAVVLTTMPAVQPSGACEALSSNTPLVLTRTRLTESLFGGWAVLVDNRIDSLVPALRSLSDQRPDLKAYRGQWNHGVMGGIAALRAFLAVTGVKTNVSRPCKPPRTLSNGPLP